MRVRERSPAALGFALANAVLAVCTLFATFWGLPLRSLWVDAPAALVALFLALSSAALVIRFRRALLVAEVAGYAVLGLGLLATAALVLGAVLLRATAGVVGSDGLRLALLAVAFTAA